MKLLIALLIIAAPVALYFLVIRPRGAHIMATYHEAGGGWAGITAVLWGFQSWLVAMLGSVVAVLPELLTVASGHDLKSMFPAPWGLWVSLGVAVAIPLLRALSTTPTGAPPSGDA